MTLRKKRPAIGWREWAAFPSLGVNGIKAKVDTGARTSAIHAFDVTPITLDGKDYVRFDVHPIEGHRLPSITCEAPVLDHRVVKSSNGAEEHRYVVETLLRLGGKNWPIELTLANRDPMGFRLLIGRQAIRKRFVVDPARSYLLGKPPPTS